MRWGGGRRGGRLRAEAVFLNQGHFLFIRQIAAENAEHAPRYSVPYSTCIHIRVCSVYMFRDRHNRIVCCLHGASGEETSQTEARRRAVPPCSAMATQLRDLRQHHPRYDDWHREGTAADATMPRTPAARRTIHGCLENKGGSYCTYSPHTAYIIRRGAIQRIYGVSYVCNAYYRYVFLQGIRGGHQVSKRAS